MSEKHYYESNHGSILHSSTPSGAAAKAYRHDLRHKLKKSQRKQAHVIHLRRRHDNKEFKYRVREVHEPVDIEKDGIMIHFEYKTKVKSMNMKSRSKSRTVSRRSKSRSKSRSKPRSKPRSKSRSKPRSKSRSKSHSRR